MMMRIHVFYVGLDEFCTERNESAAMENESETQNDESGTNNGVFRNLFIYCGAGFISHCCGHVRFEKQIVSVHEMNPRHQKMNLDQQNKLI
jgi:hypothetical protein